MIFAFATGGHPAWADDPAASTNAAPSTFLQIHPELTAPTPAEPSGLSLQPDPAATGSLSTTVSSGLKDFPDTHALFPMDPRDDLAAHLLVVYNRNDPDSQGLAEYYAAQRKIPAERVFALACPTTEEINRTQFEDTIRSPIVSYLCQKDWMVREPQRAQVGDRIMDLLVATRNDIWAIVLIRGVPLKIAYDSSIEGSMENTPELQTNAAAVDSELALLPIFGLPKGGFVPNVFFDGQAAGIKRAGPELARNMVLVTRLDGPQPSDVRRMIDDSLYAEKNRLAGLAVIDSRGLTNVQNGYTSGDVWLRSARDELVRDGWDVEFDDKPDVIPATDPCNNVALYLGWYHDGAIGPWVTPPRRFVPGAIAYHLHSFSATTVRDVTNAWVAPLIAHGADATMGMVYEPYLALTPHEDIFTRRLLQGDYFAEAAYASEGALSWMLTVVGDPLYRPFGVPLDSALAHVRVPHTQHDDWLLLMKVQRELLAGKLAPTVGNLKQALNVPGAGAVEEEVLGDLLQKLNEPGAGSAAEKAYRQAQSEETLPIDRIRTGVKLANYYLHRGQKGRAMAELDKLRELYPDDARVFGISPPLSRAANAPTNSAASQLPVPPKAAPAAP